MKELLSFIRRRGADKLHDIHIGDVDNSILKDEWLTEAQLNHHVHIVGASGFGKTVLLSRIIEQSIYQSKAVIFIDLKADIETINSVKAWARDANREKDLKFFSISDPSISTHYNLIASGSPTQLRDRIMQALTWSEEYYKNQTSSYLLKILIGLCYMRDQTNKRFTLADVYKYSVDQSAVEELCLTIPETAKREREVVESAIRFISDRENSDSLQGLRNQLESLLLSEFGSLISVTSTDGISLFDAIQNNQIIYFLLDSRRFGETAKSVARFILQDLKATSSKIDAEILREKRKPLRLVIDEFSDMATEDFISFLDRARSSKISVTVAHQEIADLKKVSEEFAGRLMGNTSTLYAFLQKRPESAELISKIAGTHKVKVRTHQVETVLGMKVRTGNESVKEVEEFAIHPNVIKSLKVGQAVCIKKYPYALSLKVKVRFAE